LISLDAIALKCPGIGPDHQHAEWGASLLGNKWVFATASEAEYSALLCNRVAAIVQAYALQKGALVPPPPAAQVTMPYQMPASEEALGHERASTGQQPRGYRVKQLIPEGKSLLTFTLLADISLGQAHTAGVA